MLLAIQLAAKELGGLAGRRRHGHGGQEAEGVGVVVGGMLALLAFVLALTLSFANARFQERRDGTLVESNAIGTAWLRARAVEHPRAAEIARLLETYTAVRRDFVAAPAEPGALQAINSRSSALQNEIWGHVSALVRERADPVAAALMTAVNDTFDAASATRFAFAYRLPPQLFWLLVGMTGISMAALGYQLGLRGLSLRFISLLLIAMWTTVVVDILDLGSARLGDFRISVQPYEWTLQGFQNGPRILPLPPR